MKIGDTVQLKSDNYPDYFVAKVNGHKIKEFITINNQPVADDHGILISRAFSKVKNKIPSILKVCILDNGEKIPVASIKIATSETMNMNLTENQIKRLKPLLTKLVNEVKQELREAPLNNWADDAKAIGGDVKLGMNTIQFLPSGGLAIKSSKASIVLSDIEAKKLAKMITDII